MSGPTPILKFKKEGTEEYLEMILSEYSWPQGGVGTCPICGAKVSGIGKDWTCENEECGTKFTGPIF